MELKHELRRLREEDQQKERERIRRLEDKRKKQIIDKQLDNDFTLKSMKTTQSQIFKKQNADTIKQLINYDNLQQTVQTVL